MFFVLKEKSKWSLRLAGYAVSFCIVSLHIFYYDLSGVVLSELAEKCSLWQRRLWSKSKTSGVWFYDLRYNILTKYKYKHSSWISENQQRIVFLATIKNRRIDQLKSWRYFLEVQPEGKNDK